MVLGFDRTGEGPTVVLLHPLGADRHVWDQVVPLLAAERDVVTVDLPGFGASPSLTAVSESRPLSGSEPRALSGSEPRPLSGSEPRPLSGSEPRPLSGSEPRPLSGSEPRPLSGSEPRALAGAVASFLADEGIERPHVIGNSLGGWVALELALAGIARAVTAIAPAGLWPRPLAPKPSIARRLARTALPLIGPLTASPRGRRLLLSGTVAHPERVPADAAAQLIRSYATASGFVAVNEAMRAGVFVDLEQIQVPVTLVWPQYDRLIARPKRLPPWVQSVELPDAGHIPMLDQPEAVARLLLDAADPEAERPDRARAVQ